MKKTNEVNTEQGMWKAALAGAVALATIGSVSVSPIGIGPAAAQEVAISESQISQLKSSLRLTAAQEHHWRPLEARLRSLRRQQERTTSEDGVVQRVRASVSGYALTAVALQRLKAAAQPLIRALNDEQKQAGLMALQSMGVTF